MGFSLSAPDGYTTARLDNGVHSSIAFSCGVDALDTYLRTQASQSQAKNLSATHVLIETNTPTESTKRTIVGYVSIANSELPLINAPKSVQRLTKLPAVPAMVLARMAVDQRHQGKGLGEFLLKYALKCAWDISQTSGCHAVIVDAKDEEVKKFYVRYGFIELPDHPLRLYIPLATVARFFVESC